MIFSGIFETTEEVRPAGAHGRGADRHGYRGAFFGRQKVLVLEDNSFIRDELRWKAPKTRPRNFSQADPGHRVAFGSGSFPGRRAREMFERPTMQAG